MIRRGFQKKRERERACIAAEDTSDVSERLMARKISRKEQKTQGGGGAPASVVSNVEVHRW